MHRRTSAAEVVSPPLSIHSSMAVPVSVCSATEIRSRMEMQPTGPCMTDILTITLNPTVDLSTAADHVHPGPKLRCDAPRADPGGGGINVSRAIRHLGGDSRAFLAVGGATGEWLKVLLDAEGTRFEGFQIDGETRQSLAVTDRSTGLQYRFVMPGPS